MFETVTMNERCSEKKYAEEAPRLRVKLFEAQRLCIEHRIPLLITVAGVNGAGRGSVVNLLSEWMDSKHLQNHVFWRESDEEKARPRDWRFWRCLPAAGETAVFFGGWYAEPLRAYCCDEVSGHEFNSRMHQCRELEMCLADSGMVLVKFWLHLDEKTHDERLKKRLKHKELLHFTPYDKKVSINYSGMLSAASKAITLTDRPFAPWTIIDATDARQRDLMVAEAIISAVNRAVAARAAKRQCAEASNAALPEETSAGLGTAGIIPSLNGIDLSSKADPATYKRELASLQHDIRTLSFKAFKRGISTTLVFEGWDASGKGGAIRRVLAGVDSRISRVIPVSAPSDEELAHHYLWRFWRHLPRAGFMTVYDRSWYGRVLVERVENLTPREDWSRAYSEINLFEEQLTANNNILLKFWLHISPEEQLRRFREREATPWKRYKITPEDWRNREKWDAYVQAADEMFLRTSTEYAPWHVIAGEDKKFARLAVLRAVREALRTALANKKK